MHSEKPTQLARDEIAKIQKNDDKLLAGHLTDWDVFKAAAALMNMVLCQNSSPFCDQTLVCSTLVAHDLYGRVPAIRYLLGA
jgi:hypothetical protein